MRFTRGLLLGVLAFSFAHAQEEATPEELIQDAQDARDEERRAKAIERDNLIANAEQQARQSSMQLESRYRELDRELAQCKITQGNADIEAKRAADQQNQQADQNAMQNGLSGLTPVLTSMLDMLGQGKSTAEAQIKNAVQDQNMAADQYAKACPGALGTGAQGLKFSADGKDASDVTGRISRQSTGALNGLGGHSSGTPAPAAGEPTCQQKLYALYLASADSRDRIAKASEQKGNFAKNIGSVLAAGLTVGAALVGQKQQKKQASTTLEDSLAINKQNAKACKEGIEAEADEIRRSLAAIADQLAADKARIARAFNDFLNKRLKLPANILNRPDLQIADEEGGGIIPSPSGNIVASNLNGKTTDPFANLNKQGPTAEGGAGGGGAPGAGGAGGSDDGKLGWGIPNPGDTANPGLAYSIPLQPEASVLRAGTEGGDGMGAGGAGDGGLFGGFQDPFANVAGVAPEGVTESSGNGFWELAMRTHRRVYAHLGELMGKRGLAPQQFGTKDAPKPERKITSTRN